MSRDRRRAVDRVVRLVRSAKHACGWRVLAGLLTLQILIALSEGVGLALIAPVIQSVQSDGTVYLAVFGVTIQSAVILMALVAVVALRAGLQWAAAVLGNRIEVRTTDDLRLTALDALLHARWSYLSAQRRSHLVQNLTTDVMRASGALWQLVNMSVNILVLVTTAVVAVILSPPIGALAILAVVCVGLASVRNVRRSGVLGTQWSDQIEAFGAVTTDSLASARVVRAHDAADIWMRSLRREAALGRAVQERYVRSSAGTRAILSVAAVVGLVGLVLLCMWLGIETAVLVALVVVVSRMLAEAQGVVEQAQSVAHEATALDKIEEVTLAAQGQRDDQSGGPTQTDTHQAGADDSSVPFVRVRDVTVVYPGASGPAVRDVSLTIDHGQSVAVVGPSGAGKSTLMDVVLGLTPPTSGTVDIDGVPMTNPVRWRSRTAYVPQDVHLIPGTVRENLTWTLRPGTNVTDDQLWQALDDAAVAEVVAALPSQLETVLSESAQLSGGERQRIAIARALLRQPELLVLDEATSAIDTGTESRVLDQLLNDGIAVLLVTHRSEAARQADVVVQLAVDDDVPSAKIRDCGEG